MKWLGKSTQIYSFFSPYPVFIGILFSFVICSMAGRDASHRNLFNKFQRFHQYITPESLFYPTASQILELSEARINRKKIAVIIGGSSISNGVGQSSKDLWTRQLQRELGSRYQVLNLAFRGGGIQEHGAITAQILFQRGYKVIYVADSPTKPIEELDYANKNYRYVFWDAYYKGLLPKYQPREDYLQKSLSPFSETRLNARLDSVTYASDLWNSIGYEHFFTVWNFIVASHEPSMPFYLPRGSYTDPDYNYQAKPIAERFSNLDATENLNLLRLYCRNYFTIGSTGELVEGDKWKDFERILNLSFPEDFRKRSLVAIVHSNPYHFEQLSDQDRTCLNRAFTLTIEKFRLAGYSSIEVGKDFTPDDYADQVHLVASGGKKMAGEVAVEVRRIAKELGYDD